MSLVLALALAAATAAPAVAAAPAPATEAVTSYPAAFFAAAQPTTAWDMVSRLPGFVFDRGDAVRGFASSAGNVLIDGARPAAKDDVLDKVLKRMPASSVLRIDLIRGGAPGIDMHGKTVIANVVRRIDPGGKLTVTASTTHAYDGRELGVLLVHGERKIGVMQLEGSMQIGRFFDDAAGQGPHTRADGSGRLIFSAREVDKGEQRQDRLNGALEAPVFGGRLRLSASLSDNPYIDRIDTGVLTPHGHEYERYFQNQETAEFGLRYAKALSPKVSSETFLLQQLSRSPQADQFAEDAQVAAVTGDDTEDDFHLFKRGGESIARTKLKYQSSPKLSFEAGLEGDYNWATNRTTFVENGAPVALPAANVHIIEDRGEAFALADWSALRTLTVEAGLRLEGSRIASTGDVVSTQSFVYAKPRLFATWSPDPSDQVRFRVEREVGQLNFDDFAANSGQNISSGGIHAGNPRLNPDQDWVFEAAAERRFWGSGDASVTARHYALSDVIDRVPVYAGSGAYDAPGNIGSGRKDELAFTLTLPTDKLGLKRGLLTGQTTFRWSRVIDPTVLNSRPISGLHSNDWEAHFTQGLPRWKAVWGFDILGQYTETFYRFNEIDSNHLKPYVAIYAEYKTRTDLVIHVEVKNVAGHGYELGREVYNGVRGQVPLSYGDDRNQHSGRFLYLRVVKTFG
ncbi:MAG: TonB-dependent receptor [Caulobacteraceae bacterium]|nr:TonB-dependent receptor [Caulobacteraceae bacterium]